MLPYRTERKSSLSHTAAKIITQNLNSMTNEDYSRLIRRMNEVQSSDKAAIVASLDCGGDIIISTMGDPADVAELKSRMIRNLEEGRSQCC